MVNAVASPRDNIKDPGAWSRFLINIIILSILLTFCVSTVSNAGLPVYVEDLILWTGASLAMLITDAVLLPDTVAVFAATDPLTEDVQHQPLPGPTERAVLRTRGQVGGREDLVTLAKGRVPHLLRVSALSRPALGLQAAVLPLHHHEPHADLETRASLQKVIAASVFEQDFTLSVTL